MKLIIFEGVFDPPHMGHYWLLRQALEEKDACGLVVVSSQWAVNSISNKPGSQSLKTRVNMCLKTFRNIDTNVTTYKDCTYSIEVVNNVIKDYPEFDEFYLLTGPDWVGKEFYMQDELKKKVTMISLSSHRTMDIRSTWIRERVKEGQDITGLTHSSIEDEVSCLYSGIEV